MDRYQFLAALHEHLKPRGYLEVGVQTGASLRLASCPALGIDPRPVLRYELPASTVVAPFESDAFFALPRAQQLHLGMPQPLDLAFIDGMHLWEFALRDFRNVESWSHPDTVVVFDDVLPRNQHEASRAPLPGDWTGDVWRVTDIIASLSPSVRFALVDTQPTGLLLVWGLSPGRDWSGFVPTLHGQEVPADVLDRTLAVSAETALAAVATW